MTRIMLAKPLRFLLLLALPLVVTACGGGYDVRVLDEPSIYQRPPASIPSPPPGSAPGQTSPGRPLKGWERPYVINGQRFDPLLDHRGFVEEGLASWYGEDFHGKKTSNGEIYDMYAMTAAHKTLPLGVFVKVRNLSNGRETILRVNDRGPFVAGRIIDLSYSGAKELGVVGPGTAPVRVEALGYQVTDAGGHVAYQSPPSYDIGSFSVQVGAFTVAGNAQRLAAEMEQRHGFGAVQTGTVNGTLFHRVRAGKYRSLEAAESARQAFENQGYRSSFVVALD